MRELRVRERLVRERLVRELFGIRSVDVCGLVGSVSLIVSTTVSTRLTAQSFFFFLLFAFFFLAAFFEVVIGLSCQVINSLVSVVLQWPCGDTIAV